MLTAVSSSMSAGRAVIPRLTATCAQATSTSRAGAIRELRDPDAPDEEED